VTAVPGLTPRSPEIIDGPVLVTVVPANTAKDVAVPNPTGGWTDAANAAGAPAMSAAAAIVPTVNTALNPMAQAVPAILIRHRCHEFSPINNTSRMVSTLGRK